MTQDHPDKIGQRAGHKCEYCDKDLLDSVDNYESWQFEHIIPKSAEINEKDENYALNCYVCNKLKDDWNPKDIAGQNASREKLIQVARQYIAQKRRDSAKKLSKYRKIVGKDLEDCEIRIDRPVTDYELRSLATWAISEEKEFFDRNSHLKELYRQRLILIALCQGAALQYLGCGCGVKDFDIHFFYAQNPDKPRLARTVKQIYGRVGSFPQMPIHFIRTVLPQVKPHLDSTAGLQTVRQFLQNKPTSNACYLSQKAVIALWPDEVFAAQVWPYIM